jgi:acyl carrier protein
MTRDEIFGKVRDVLVDALAVDEEEVTPTATLTGDLGAESIDFLDITFKLEQAFNIKIPQGTLLPEGVQNNPKFVVDGKVTPDGVAMLKEKLPHVDFTSWEKDPQVANVLQVFTVDALVKFVEQRLKTK